MYAGMMLFFVSNAIESQLLSTGAFEISFNSEYLCLNSSLSVILCGLPGCFLYIMYNASSLDEKRWGMHKLFNGDCTFMIIIQGA